MARTEAIPVEFKLNNEIPHCRSLWIGILQGSWKEIGIQYGQRCGKDIARNFDLNWEQLVLKGQKGNWRENKSPQKRAEYCVAYIKRSFKELSYLSPELIELFHGIGQGASKELDRCLYASVCSHFEKIALLNYSSTVHFHPDWDFVNDCPNRTGHSGVIPDPGMVSAEDDCNGFWVKGKGTKTGYTYATRTAQSKHIQPGGSARERQVSYVAVPKDPNAQVFWGNGRAGNLGGIGGGLLNGSGLCCLTSGAQDALKNRQYIDATLAPGIRDFLLATYGVIFSKTAGEASERITAGSESYRMQTGRKTVLRARGCNIVFADADDAFCVEQNARYYAVRRPGDLGEKDGNYLVHANHFKSERGSYDENNRFHEDIPMTQFRPERIDSPNGSYYRFWSGMWMLSNYYGQIDEKLMMENLVASHYGYDAEGNRYDPDPVTGVPSAGGKYATEIESWHGTFCAHIKPYTQENPKGIGGNAETSVFNLSTREVWWVPVWPCHYKEWNLSWSYLDLKPFVEYRKLLWGY
ncbi:MAG: hypothetical protein AB1427_17935 [Thermodesulfobacteriota bacterium]